jgi:hypothetical protein
MARFSAFLAALTLLAGAATAVGVGRVVDSPSGVFTRSEASSVAFDFFTSLNERRYGRTCDLLSRSYLEAHGLQRASLCSLGLRIGFLWSQEIRFRLGEVRLHGRQAVVRAVADGATGELVLVREGGRFKVLAVRGG